MKFTVEFLEKTDRSFKFKIDEKEYETKISDEDFEKMKEANSHSFSKEIDTVDVNFEFIFQQAIAEKLMDFGFKIARKGNKKVF